MQKLAHTRQVLAVTHLPQVAAYAHQHFQVKKARSGSQTISNVLALNATERENELARMLGGEEVTEISIAHARQMLKHALST
jgi:DNA repair protein RecN (Recombination protein N)